MRKSTFLLGGVCVALLSSTISVIMWWWQWPVETVEPVLEGDFSIGLTDSGHDSEAGELVESLVLWDSNADMIELETNSFRRRPIASITKLMTAMVAVDYGVDWDKQMTIQPNEQAVGGKLVLHIGEFVTMRDLMHASLMGSANNATSALVRGLEVDEDEFIREMNRKAIELNLEQAEFVDVTGLDPNNVATAYEVSRLAESVWRDYPQLAEISSKAEYRYTVGGSGREHTIRNTNNLMTERGFEFSGSKTGYLYEAGFCLVVQSKDGRVAVVMGSKSESDSMNQVVKLLGL